MVTEQTSYTFGRSTSEDTQQQLVFTFLKDCIGALDGTHIEARLSDHKGNQHRGRKGTKT
ncbi:hypothetical protein QQ045_008253 [Rhodiola kirilowii]